jgi:hypothetical protein
VEESLHHERDVRLGWWSQLIDATLYLKRKDGVYEYGSEISSRFYRNRTGRVVGSQSLGDILRYSQKSPLSGVIALPLGGKIEEGGCCY